MFITVIKEAIKIAVDEFKPINKKTFSTKYSGVIFVTEQTKEYKEIFDKCEKYEGIYCPLAIETSGHAALKENYFLDDGAYLVTKIVIELARGTDIAGVIKPMALPEEELEVRLSIKARDFKAVGERVIAELTDYVSDKPQYTVAPDNREGIRVSTQNGWFLLRLSVHDPVMPLNFESNIKGGIKEDLTALVPFFEQFEELDISAMKNH